MTDETPTARAIRLIQEEERERCAKIAEAHIGAAERTRQQRGQTFRNMPIDAAQEIEAEERGETIAAEMIARAIRAIRP